jgi:ABC-type cobalamin/Fe3+-siderophores transport system ATPase subunit
MSLPFEQKILELERISYCYDRGPGFIQDLSFTLGQGAFIGLLGANGSGKSTILKLASGILKPSAGHVRLWGTDLHSLRNRDRAKLISYLPQTLDMSIPFTIAELVGMGLYPYDIPPAMSVGQALDMVGLRDKSASYLSDLSGGERRRAFIAMTLVQGAGLLLLDEPLANLDIKYQMELIRLLRRLREENNISVVMALHDITIALQFDTVMLVKNGGLIGSGRPASVLTRDMLKLAFGVGMEVRTTSEGTYIEYEEKF